MKESGKIRYIVELFIMIIIMFFVIVVLVGAFTKSYGLSEKADKLTESVSISESIAEISNTCASNEDFLHVLSDIEVNSVADDKETGLILIDYDNDYDVEVKRAETVGSSGVFVSSFVTVYSKGDSTPVYSLETGSYLRGAEQ